MSDLRQVCAELRGIPLTFTDFMQDCDGPYESDYPNPEVETVDPLSWDSVGELRDAAIKQGARAFRDALCKVLALTIYTYGAFDVFMEGHSLDRLTCATPEQILAAAISVLRPMEVDEAVRLVDEWSERK